MRSYQYALFLALALLTGCGGTTAPTQQEAVAFIEEAESTDND